MHTYKKFFLSHKFNGMAELASMTQFHKMIFCL